MISKDGSRIKLTIDTARLKAQLAAVGIIVEEIAVKPTGDAIDRALAALPPADAPRPDLISCIMGNRVFTEKHGVMIDAVIPESNRCGIMEITRDAANDPRIMEAIRNVAIIYDVFPNYENTLMFKIKSPQLMEVQGIVPLPTYECRFTETGDYHPAVTFHAI